MGNTISEYKTTAAIVVAVVVGLWYYCGNKGHTTSSKVIKSKIRPNHLKKKRLLRNNYKS